MKKTWIAWILVFIMAAVMIFLMPVKYGVKYDLEGLAVYEDEAKGQAPCTVTVDGTYASYMAKDDRLEAEIKIDGQVLTGEKISFTFPDKTGCTELTGGAKGTVRLSSTGREAVIDICYDSEKKAFTTDEAYRCTVYAPAEDDDGIKELLRFFSEAEK